MSDIVRVSFTVEEAAAVAELIEHHWFRVTGGTQSQLVRDAAGKLRKALANPLNGPTEFKGPSDVADGAAEEE